jgi:hypothetical protein
VTGGAGGRNASMTGRSSWKGRRAVLGVGRDRLAELARARLLLESVLHRVAGRPCIKTPMPRSSPLCFVAPPWADLAGRKAACVSDARHLLPAGNGAWGVGLPAESASSRCRDPSAVRTSQQTVLSCCTTFLFTEAACLAARGRRPTAIRFDQAASPHPRAEGQRAVEVPENDLVHRVRDYVPMASAGRVSTSSPQASQVHALPS